MMITLIKETKMKELLDPDMPAQELRLAMGELSSSEILVVRAAIRWANTKNQEDLPDALFWAFRYALGRQSYVTGSVSDLLIKHWLSIKANDRDTIKQEITEAIENGRAGMDCDVEVWKKVLEL